MPDCNAQLCKCSDIPGKNQ